MRNPCVLAARVAALALLVPVLSGCASSGDNVAAGSSGTTAPAPVVLTGATLLADGDSPRLLLTGNGPLAPTLYNREGSTKVVIDVANAVAAPGLEPPRADGTLLSRLEMKSFVEMGKPHIQFELTARVPLEPAISSDSGSPAMAVSLVKAAPVLVASAAPAAPPAEMPVVKVEAEPSVKAEEIPAPAATTSTTTSIAVSEAAPVPVHHAATGSRATRLSGVAVAQSGGRLVVTLSGNGSFAYETFALANPPRYVVDLPGVLLATPKKSQDVRHPAVTRVRASQFKGGLEPVTRVVFDLASPVEPAAKSASAGLAFAFGSGSSAPAVAAAPIVKEAPAPLVKVEAPAPAPVNKVTAAPEKVAVIAAPAASSYEKHEVEDAAEPVVKAAPAPATPAPVAVAAAPPATFSAPPQPVAAPEPAVSDAPHIVTATPEIRLIPAEKPAPVASAASRPVPPAAEPAPKRRKTSEDKALIEAAETLLNQQDAAGKPREIANPFEARTLGAGDKQYTGEPITLNLKDADIKDTLQRFSELTQLNIVLDPDVRGTVTVSLQEIPWDQALELILKINQLGYVLEGNVMRIASSNKLLQEEQARLAFSAAQDKNRPLRTVLQKISYSNVSEMAATARKVMSSRGDIFVDARSNTLVIKELPDYLPTVLDLIKNLDVASPQVMIEARIIEANRTFSNEIGVVWGFQGVADAAHGNTTGLVFPNSGNVAGNVSLPSGAPQVLSLSLANVLDTFRLDASIHAAESRGLVKVVSTPKVQTQTGEAASIQSGFQIPVQTTVNNTTSVLYINATLRLDVTPQITNEGTVIMDVTVQKREPAVGINIAGGQNIPLTTRDAKTRLMVRDGGTAVIGGIFKITSNDGQSMIPGLWKIPIIGNLFRSRTQSENTDELMIFITPRIIR
ncbi:MAG: type IV pilus secretin PilQ [Acidobacteria bacterium]|nr:type IV pilus secretin PilQ [Acidobacteriota bacterium]